MMVEEANGTSSTAMAGASSEAVNDSNVSAAYADSSTDLFDPDKLFRQHLTRGFSFVRKHVEERLAAESNNNNIEHRLLPGDPEGTPDFLTKVEVNFIDPTSFSPGVVANNTTKQEPLELYSKIKTTFAREYKSTLQQVPFTNFRSGAEGTIESLHVQPVTTHTIGGTMVSIATTDATDWHKDPYCHVYIAACENLDHYRTTVRPSLQAVVSQLEAASYKGRYMIVYVPTGRPSSDDMASSQQQQQSHGRGHRVRAFAHRMAAARQRMAAARNDASSITPAAATTTTTTTDGDGETATMTLGESADSVSDAGSSQQATASSTGGVGTMTRLTSAETNLIRRFKTDFPTGRICTLSSLMDFQESSDVYDAEEYEWFKMEWETFMKRLGATIVDGFRDRCKRYDDELKRLAKEQATAEIISVEDSVHYVLVKESFAFTYEQMRQHSEALLQYEELRAILPDVRSEHFSATNENALRANDGRSVLQIALSGDVLGFRACLLSVKDLTSISGEIEHYLLARESQQLFGMLNPIGVVRRCAACVQKMYSLKRSQALRLENEDAMTQAHRWAFEFCWDVKLACSIFSSSGVKKGTRGAEDFARVVCDIINFARFRLLDLGKAYFPEFKAPNIGGREFAAELKRSEWVEWQEPDDTSDTALDEVSEIPVYGIIPFALSSVDSFQTLHANLTKNLATSMESCGRRRYAACLRLEAIDIAIRRKQLGAAEKELDSVATTYALDTWRACNFYILFQLAKLQRKARSARTYLNTLVKCFSDPDSPAKALSVLFDDLANVTICQSLSGTKLAAASIFQPVLGLEDFKMVNVTLSDRNLFKKAYSVGDTVRVTISLFSQLPKEIKVSNISISLVSFQKYVAAVEDSIVLPEEDVFHKLCLHDVTIIPGRNDFSIEWTPMSSGQVVLASAALQWGNCVFTYTVKEMRRPTVRIDVIPCEPTQSLEITPTFLVPGHTQPIQILFKSENDVVDRGTVQLVGSPGVHLCSTDEDTSNPSMWHSTMELELPSCDAGDTTVLSVFVKSEINTDGGSGGILHAKATTFFQPKSRDSKVVEGESDRVSASQMECSLETKIGTIGKAAFETVAAEVAPYSANGLMISFALECKAPAPFTLQKWSLDLPEYLALSGDEDLNRSLANCSVCQGERLALSFDCVVHDELPLVFEVTLSVTYVNGTGTTFADSIKHRFSRPSTHLIPKAEAEEVMVTLSSSTSEGLVGSPIDFVFSIDITDFPFLQGKEVRYKVHSSPTTWLLHGKLKGVISRNAAVHRLSFVAIPTIPGLITDYPSIALTIADDAGRLSEVPVVLKHPGPFLSDDLFKQTTVAFVWSDMGDFRSSFTETSK